MRQSSNITELLLKKFRIFFNLEKQKKKNIFTEIICELYQKTNIYSDFILNKYSAAKVDKWSQC